MIPYRKKTQLIFSNFKFKTVTFKMYFWYNIIVFKSICIDNIVHSYYVYS